VESSSGLEEAGSAAADGGGGCTANANTLEVEDHNTPSCCWRWPYKWLHCRTLHPSTRFEWDDSDG